MAHFFNIGDSVRVSSVLGDSVGVVSDVLYRSEIVALYPHLFDYRHFPLFAVSFDGVESFLFSGFRLSFIGS